MRNTMRWSGLAGLLVAGAAACGSEAGGGGGADASSGGNSDILIDGDLSSDSGSDAGTAGGSGNRDCDPVPGCNDLAVEFESVRPTVMILVDRSSSMFDIPFGDSPNRWQPLKDALVGAGGVVDLLEDSVRFGFATYTNRQADATCPLLDQVPIDYGNYEPIKTLYDAVSSDPIKEAPSPDLEQTYKGETPTGEAIRAILPGLIADQAPGPKYLMLVTDGEPDTCAVPDPQCGQYEAIAAVQEAFAQGIQTFVVGVGDIGLDHLQALANAGMGQPVAEPELSGDCPDDVPTPGDYSAEGGTAPYYRPEDPDALKNAIANIIGGVRTCSFELSVEVNLAMASTGTVLLDCAAVPFDDANGWRMNTPTELELVGDACFDLRASLDPFLFITFPCGTIVK